MKKNVLYRKQLGRSYDTRKRHEAPYLRCTALSLGRSTPGSSRGSRTSCIPGHRPATKGVYLIGSVFGYYVLIRFLNNVTLLFSNPYGKILNPFSGVC